MIAEKKVEKQENSSVKLTVTVNGEETSKAYKDLLTKYSKEIQIKGFRKGHVPPIGHRKEIRRRNHAGSLRLADRQRIQGSH